MNNNFNLVSFEKYFNDPGKYILGVNAAGKFSLAERSSGQQEQTIEELKNIYKLAVKPVD